MNDKALKPLSSSELLRNVRVQKTHDDVDYPLFFRKTIDELANYAVGPYYWFITDNSQITMLDCSDNINQFLPYSKEEWLKAEGAFERCAGIYHPDDQAFVYACLSFAMKYPQTNELALQGKIRFNIYTRALNAQGEYRMTLIQFPLQYFNEKNENESSLVLTTDLSHLPLEPVAMMTVIDNSHKEPRYFKMLNHQKNELQAVSLPKITSREQDVLHLLTKGYTSPQIAQTLKIAENTVENHKRNLREKTNTKNVAELISYVYKHNLL